MSVPRPRKDPGPEEPDADKARDSHKSPVILTADEFKISEVLDHIEAGRTVIVVPAPRPAD